jgi:hypothetical protein
MSGRRELKVQENLLPPSSGEAHKNDIVDARDRQPGCTVIINAACFSETRYTSTVSVNVCQTMQCRISKDSSPLSSDHLFCSVISIWFWPLSTDPFVSLCHCWGRKKCQTVPEGLQFVCCVFHCNTYSEVLRHEVILFSKYFMSQIFAD